MMTPFAELLERATARAGGPRALEAELPQPKSAAELRAVGDDRYLSLMSRRVFRAGLKHALVDAKWPAFEAAFHGFEPHAVRAMSDEDLERLMGDKRLIRHFPKMKAVRANAAALLEAAAEHGSFGAYLADWPAADIVGLWGDLGKRFSQLGGNSAPAFLRMAGKDTFIITGDVGRGLVETGACERPPKTRAELKAAQAAFNAWAEEGRRPLCQVSKVLALAVG
jgi:3-methyladenine DNA glycosylase Tag